MSALPSIVTDFLTKIKNDLSVGSDLATPGSGNIRGAAVNYLRAQDLASVLELLQNALSSPLATGTLTFTGVATGDEEVIIGAITYVWKAAPAAAYEVDIGVDAATCVANLVAAIMASGTPGVEYGTGTLAHPDVTAVDGAGDTVVVSAKVGGLAGNDIATTTDMADATWGAATLTGGTDAGGVALTATGNGTDRTFVEGASTFVANAHVGDKFTFGSATTTVALRDLTVTVLSNTTTTLTFAEVLPDTTATGDVGTLVSAAMDAAISELRDGKNLADAPSGNVYGEYRTVVDALLRLGAKVGASLPERNIGRPGLEVAAGSTTDVVALETAGIPFRIDELRGAKIVVTGQDARTVVRNDEDSVLVDKPYASPPAATTAVALTVPSDKAHNPYGMISIHAGRQAGENEYLAFLIDQIQDAVEDFVIPV